MEANLIKVGNSKGIIIPSKFLKLIGISERVKINVEGNKLIIEPIADEPRKDWAEVFKQNDSCNPQENSIPDVFEDEPNADWTW